jgi:hypothetical protein
MARLTSATTPIVQTLASCGRSGDVPRWEACCMNLRFGLRACDPVRSSRYQAFGPGVPCLTANT